ncbi:MAG: S1C family serine protease, partial [Vicinamibacterales bacterium]
NKELADAVAAAESSVVQLHGRRPVAAVAIDSDIVIAPAAAVHHDTVAVRTADGRALEGTVLGRTSAAVSVVRVPGLNATPARAAGEPRVGELALAVGRTWSGNVFSALAPVSVVGGPLRTGRRSELARVIRVGIPPHGALVGGALVSAGGGLLGIITGAAIRGTTVVIPASIAVAAARELVSAGSTRHGFIGVTSLPVVLPATQQVGGHERGVLVTGVSPEGPAGTGGMLVGDVIVSFADKKVQDHEELLNCLTSERIGQPAAIGVVRGTSLQTLSVIVGERPGV